MSRGLKIILILLALAALVLAVLWYPKYKQQKAEKKTESLSSKSAELSDLIGKRECNSVISQANAILAENQNLEEIWNLKGACEFDTGNFEQAKLSFEKVLSLNPNHEGAKTYLEQLRPRPGEIMLAAAELPVEQKEFESRLGFSPEGILKFQKAVKRPANIPEYLLADYTAQSFEEAVALFKNRFEMAKSVFTETETDEGTILAESIGFERKIFKVQKGSPVKVLINYQKLH